MLQKLTIGALVLTVVAAIGLGVYESSQDTPTENIVLRAEATPTAQVVAIQNTPTSEPVVNPTVAVDGTVQGAIEATDSLTPSATPDPLQNSMEMVGDNWAGVGIVAALDDVGMTLTDGTYVELAPSFYWVDVPLNVGDTVGIVGFNNGEQIHTQTLTVNGETYAFRTADGQPLWSGGVGENGAENSGQNEQQVPMSEWETYTGVLTTVMNNSLILQTTDGQVITLQLGQPRFRDDQGITFMVGDLVETSGYWQNGQLRVGTLTKTATGETLLLLDPNGRPLWGGPGRGGNSSATTGTEQATGGQGNGYRGGRTSTTPTTEVTQ